MTTTNQTSPQPGFLDRSAAAVLSLDWEKIAWITLLVVALLLRLYDVGARTMSHDESLHTTYSHHLYSGVGFRHDPLMHGPLLFHLTAASYFLFGPSDFSARLPVVLLGVGIVWLLWLTRRWLGKTGAFLAAAMMAFSPTLLFHSRYIRHDIYAIFFILAVAIFAFQYIDRGDKKWMYLMAGALGLSFTTKEVAFISAVILASFFVVWAIGRLLTQEWERSRFKIPFVALSAVGGLLAVYAMYETMTAPVGEIVVSARLGGLPMWPLFLVGLALVLVGLYLLWRGYGSDRLRSQRDIEVMVWVLTLSAPLFSAFPIKLFGGNPQSITISSSMLTSQTIQGGVIFLAMLVIFSAIGFVFSRERFLIGLGMFYGLMLVFFTTFFTNGNGIATGLVGSVGYWLGQQEVARGSQPWFYYFLLVPLYEFLPLLLAILGAFGLAISEFRRRRKTDQSENGAYPVKRQWLWYLVWWTLATWAAYTWAGEKMPWLTTHFTVPMAMLGGWWLGKKITHVDWRNAWRSGAAWLLLGFPLWVFVFGVFIRMTTQGPFRDASLSGLSNTVGWIAALLMLVGLGYILFRQGRKVGFTLVKQMALFSLLIVLSLFSIRTAFMASYVNYDLPVEPLVYAHASPDIKIVVSDLEEMSRRTVGEGQLAFAYDNETTWPFEWYFRDFPNKKFFGGSPSRDVLRDAPVVLVGTENEDKVKPYLGNDYYRIPYRQIWWPKETYKQLNWTQLKTWVSDPQALCNFLGCILFRRYRATAGRLGSLRSIYHVCAQRHCRASVGPWRCS